MQVGNKRKKATKPPEKSRSAFSQPASFQKKHIAVTGRGGQAQGKQRKAERSRTKSARQTAAPPQAALALLDREAFPCHERMSRSHPNIGTKRSYEGDQADEDTNEQFAHVANMQTKLVHTEKALKNLSAPAARLEAQATEALADPAVYLELEQTRRQHDAL